MHSQIHGRGFTCHKKFNTPLRKQYLFFDGIAVIIKILSLPVISKMILTSKGFVANITRVGPFISVSSFMYEQIVRFCELSVTKFTNKLLFWPRCSTGCP